MHFLRSQESQLILAPRPVVFGLATAMLVFFFPTLARAEVQRFRLRPEESRILTRINDPFGSMVSGTLRLREGQASADPDRLEETGTVNLLLDAATYDSDLAVRDKTVRQDYLEVEQYPTIRFTALKVVQLVRSGPAGEGWNILLRGTFFFHGVKKETTVPVQLRYDGEKIVAQGRLQILLEDFKIAVPSLLFLKAGNHVDVEFTIIGER